MRNMWKFKGRKLLAATVVAAMTMGAGAALAQGPGARDGQGAPGQGPRLRCQTTEPGERMAQRLGLDEKQQEAVVQIHQEGRTRDLALRKEVMRLRNELRGEMLKDNPAEGAVLSLSDKIADVQKELRGNRLKDRLAIRKLLTPEQRDKMLLMGGPDGRGGRGHRPGGRDAHFDGRFGDGPGMGGRGGWDGCPRGGEDVKVGIEADGPEPDQE